MAKTDLDRANKDQLDEFYTLYSDIAGELSKHSHIFKDKIVYCNCDGERSNFVKYFTDNFEKLGLKDFIATSYNGAGKGKLIQELSCNGSFDSFMLIQYIMRADIVVTNPPFSLIRDYFKHLNRYKKKFILVAPHHILGYKEMKDSIIKGELRILSAPNSFIFEIPNHYTNFQDSKRMFVRDRQQYIKGYNNSMNELISISHKIELKPNNKAKTHFKKAFGCARLAYNWALAKCQENYKQGIKSSAYDLKKEFNSIKKEQYPFTYEVSKYATQQPFLNLDRAFKKYFADLKKGKVSYPKFKRKRDNQGSYYLGGDVVSIKDNKYLKIPNLGLVKLKEKLRFDGKIDNVVIYQKANKFFASFSMKISKAEYNRTHKKVKAKRLNVGIDLGISSFATLSNGLQITAPKPLDKLTRLLTRRQRQLNKKQHAKTKGEALKGAKKSNNYVKASNKLCKLHTRIVNIRLDFIHKLTSHLVRNYDEIALETLQVTNMLKNHRLAKSLSDVSLSKFNEILEYKAKYNGVSITRADRFYPSSKTCSHCGSIKSNLTLSQRIFICDECGYKIDRDLNASINLAKLLGQVLPEVTPGDLTALLDDLVINNLTTSKVETGMQQKVYK